MARNKTLVSDFDTLLRQVSLGLKRQAAIRALGDRYVLHPDFKPRLSDPAFQIATWRYLHFSRNYLRTKA